VRWINTLSERRWSSFSLAIASQRTVATITCYKMQIPYYWSAEPLLHQKMSLLKTLWAGRSRSLFSRMTSHIWCALIEKADVGTAPRQSPARPPGAIEWYKCSRNSETCMKSITMWSIRHQSTYTIEVTMKKFWCKKFK